jgi:hypothetical protein
MVEPKSNAPELDSATPGEKYAQSADPAASESGLVLAAKAIPRKHSGFTPAGRFPSGLRWVTFSQIRKFVRRSG